MGSAARASYRIARPEIVTVVIRREDYAKLKHAGGPRPDQICMALRHYLKILGEMEWRPSVIDHNGHSQDVKTFQCGVPKDVCDEIRSLPGRFDTHTIEAMRLFLL